MESFNRLIEIRDECLNISFIDNSTLIRLRRLIHEAIEITQLLELNVPEFNSKFIINNLKKDREELDSYSSPDMCFNYCIDDLKHDLNEAINSYTTYIRRD